MKNKTDLYTKGRTEAKKVVAELGIEMMGQWRNTFIGRRGSIL